MLSLWGWGHLRLSASQNTQEQMKEPFYVRLVQAHVEQPHKWDPLRQMEILRRYLELSQRPSEHHPISAIIWPESALPFLLQDRSWVHEVLADMIPEGSHLIMGALRAEQHSDLEGDYSIWNSLFVLNEDAELLGTYDKTHLVPFGEYIPFRNILPLKKITEGSKDFSKGDGIKTLKIGTIPPFSPLICYEVIFPDAVVDHGDLPRWMVNVTNDAWFGVSTGPYQHLHMSRFRAVEQGVPLVRVANTGVSAIIDSYGRIKKTLPLGEKAVLDAALPQFILGGTVYQKRGVFLVLSIAYALGLLVFWKVKL
jgi:apolipoprotein N-acyltransferase